MLLFRRPRGRVGVTKPDELRSGRLKTRIALEFQRPLPVAKILDVVLGAERLGKAKAREPYRLTVAAMFDRYGGRIELADCKAGLFEIRSQPVDQLAPVLHQARLRR